jgi:demethylmenaquinone methyltransferase/2-methoxy-6-polyprenyl-1,4-benzoquinol methylase
MTSGALPQSGTELSRYYAARAREYERIYDKPERQPDLERLKRAIPRYFAGADVLEIACGTGYWTQFIAPVARKVTAIDINAETLAIARSKPIPPERIKFEVRDVYDLPRDETFTAAFAGFWWSHVPRADLGGFIGSLHRALRPGATVVVLDNRYVEGSSTPVSRVDADGNSYQRRRLDDGSEHEVLKNFPTETELRSALDSFASAIEYTAYDHYWLLKYEVAA